MAKERQPKILIVDDQPDGIRGELQIGLGKRATAEVLHPDDVGLADLENSDLVLVDFKLEYWPVRDSASLAMSPINGLALAVVLREHRDRSIQNRLTAFALHSGHLDDVRGRLPTQAREHLIARLNNLEWAFSKHNVDRWKQMLVLAKAVQELPRNWPVEDHQAAESEAMKLLGLPESEVWFDRARRNVLSCHPPIHELSGGAHGLLFVRWLLHQIMPYPTFLWREEWVAARLRIEVETLRTILKKGEKLGRDLQAMEYQGVLAGFLGPRWWRPAVEAYVWNLTDGDAVNVEALHAALRKRTKLRLKVLAADASLVCLGSDFLPSGEVISAADAVRIQPDQWPPFADDAWTSLERARQEPTLRAVVHPMDESLFDSDQSDD